MSGCDLVVSLCPQLFESFLLYLIPLGMCFVVCFRLGQLIHPSTSSNFQNVCFVLNAVFSVDSFSLIGCPAGLVVVIHDACFGQGIPPSYCDGCTRYSDNLHKIRSWCDGKTACSSSAKTSELPNNNVCTPGKKLDVRYSCQTGKHAKIKLICLLLSTCTSIRSF